MPDNPLNILAAEADAWVADALCGESVKDVWGNPAPMPNMFPSAQDQAGIELAKGVCDGCPVKSECLAAAMTNGEQHGIWGGLTPEERTSARRAQSRRESAVRKLIQDQVAVNPGQAKVIRGQRVEDVAVAGGVL